MCIVLLYIMIYILHLVVISYLKVRSYRYTSFQRNPCKPKVSETKMYGKLSLFVNSETKRSLRACTGQIPISYWQVIRQSLTIQCLIPLRVYYFPYCLMGGGVSSKHFGFCSHWPATKASNVIKIKTSVF